MGFSIREDLSEIEMWRHREDLLGHLDHVLEQSDLGLEHLGQHEPGIDEGDIRQRKDQYGTLREVLLEVDMEATETLIREPLRLTTIFRLLIPTDRHKVPLDVFMCNSSLVSIAACSGHPLLINELPYPSIRDLPYS